MSFKDFARLIPPSNCVHSLNRAGAPCFAYRRIGQKTCTSAQLARLLNLGGVMLKYFAHFAKGITFTLPHRRAQVSIYILLNVFKVVATCFA